MKFNENKQQPDKELFEDRLKVDVSQEEQRKRMLDYMDQLAQESLERNKQKQRENKKRKDFWGR